ncbi:MAG: 50S ribosomal protein L35 [Clostridia bacterium]|jgi:large subunit ribosomal protein L35|nr:50S ribosomal protein L35 [Clostridia bacterium]MBR7159477.1 50S ribosomal protein L35 [Clostridia bacterium]
MPKMKTHSGAKKRFRVKKSGLVKMAHCGKNHILTKKSSKRKAHLRKGAYVDATISSTIKSMIHA